MAIPAFRNDGLLPIGVHHATEAEVLERFGKGSIQRAMLKDRLSNWLAHARAVKALRFLADGSFVTAKPEPKDVDCAVWVPGDFDTTYRWGKLEAVKLYQAAASGQPAEIYLVSEQSEWDYWVRLFSRIREDSKKWKGIVEVML